MGAALLITMAGRGLSAFDPASFFASGENGSLGNMRVSTDNMAQDSDGTGTVTAGDVIGYVTDLSGNDNHAIQDNAADKGIWGTDADGNKGLYLDGTGKFLKIPKAALTVGNDYTLIALYRMTANTDAFAAVVGPDDGASGIWQVHDNLTLKPRHAVITTTPQTIAESALAADAITVGNTYMMRQTWDRSAGTLTTYNDGDMIIETTGTPADIDPPTDYTELGRSGADTRNLTGFIYAYILIDRILTDEEVASFREWAQPDTGLPAPGFTYNVQADDVPSEVTLVVFTGQSNNGTASTESAISLAATTACQYRSSGFEIVEDPTGYGSGDMDASLNGSYIPKFVQDYTAASGEYVVAVGVWSGATGIDSSSGTTPHWGSDGTLRAEALAVVNDAITYLTAQGKTIAKKIIIPWHGESDAAAGRTAPAFEAGWEDLIQFWRAGLGDPNLKFFFHKIGGICNTTTWAEASAAATAVINGAIDDLVAGDSNVHLASSGARDQCDAVEQGFEAGTASNHLNISGLEDVAAEAAVNINAVLNP